MINRREGAARRSAFGAVRVLAVLAACAAAALAPRGLTAATPGAPERPDPPDPSVRLFDTGSRAILLHPRQVADRKGWTPVSAGRLDHRFAGDAAIANDKVAVVIHRVGQAFSCFPLGDGARWACTVQPRPYPTGEYVLKVLENSAAAVAVEAADENSDNPAAAFRLRVTVGEPLVELRPAPGMEKVNLLGAMDHVVVPDFFGDDMVFSRESAGRAPVALPVENVLLALGDAGLLACVWEARDAGAAFCPSLDGGPHVEMACREGKRIWIACLDGPGLWQRMTVDAGRAPLNVLRGFRPPLAAKWRADFVGKAGVCDSITFDAPPDGVPVPPAWRGDVLVYPLDRTAATPLAAVLPVDVLRRTLGVGPCEYVLAREGLASDDLPATPAAVTEWVEKQFERGRDARSAEAIRERLAAMVEHVRRADARIAAYAAFAEEVRAACRSAAGANAGSAKDAAAKNAGDAAQSAGANAAATAAAVLAVCDRMDHDLARGRAAAKTPDEAASLAAAVADLIGKEGALAECRRLGEALRSIGHAQDATLARCRMAARRIRLAGRDAEGAFADQVRAMAERVLGRQ